MAKKAGGKIASARVTRKAAALGAGSAFPIVGVGASAGGLEAFTQLLEHLPADQRDGLRVDSAFGSYACQPAS